MTLSFRSALLHKPSLEGLFSPIIESLSSFGLFISGSSGVQGEWPKLLLTQGHDELFYLDHTLPDEMAKQHWLVKFSRGTDQRLNKILGGVSKSMLKKNRLDFDKIVKCKSH